MININKNLEKINVTVKPSSMEEQYALWQIMTNPSVSEYNIETPDSIFEKHNLRKDSIEDLKEARNIFLDDFYEWNNQEEKFVNKVQNIATEPCFSIFKNNGVVGEIYFPIYHQYKYTGNVHDICITIDPSFKNIGNDVVKELVEYILYVKGTEKILTEQISDNKEVIEYLVNSGLNYYINQTSTLVRTNDDGSEYIVPKYGYYLNSKKHMYNK